MDEIKTIREALERFGRKANYNDDEDGEELADMALAALSRLAEPGEDARRLAFAVSRSTDDKWSACEIERYAAAREAKAREEERERCAKKAGSWFESYVLDTVDARFDANALRAAIKEAPDA